LQEPDDDFADDAATDRSEMPATFHDVAFLEDVQPEWRGLIETQAIAAQLT
jgi:hypothetical protein